jgi:subtilisin-like proprotein convertase family protein
VFAAGNSGGGGNSGLNGIADSIGSPATAKNVITVGAADQARFISNWVQFSCGNVTNIVGGVTNIITVCQSNQPWLGMTDSDNQVAPFSSRGNVGIGLEGQFGRMKPDLVAPGSMTVSARSAQYQEPDGSTNVFVFQYNDTAIAFDTTNLYALNIPPTAIQVIITNVATPRSPTNPLPDLLIGADMDAIPVGFLATNRLVLDPTTTPALRGGTLFYTIANPYYSNTVVFDLVVILTVTNDVGDYFTVLKKLNEPLKPYYRYEAGTSMAAPKISGMLAMLQEFCATNLGGFFASNRPSPALMKALLINGARSLSGTYNLNPHAAINHQGWGIPSMSNSIPYGFTGDMSNGPIRIIEQRLTNGLATGGTETYEITVPPRARSFPLRMTLVWTDPPGNPITGVKLVNDLNMIATNTTTNVVGGITYTSAMVWVGNNFPPGSDFTTPITVASTDPDAQVSTNAQKDIEDARDYVNNVENIYIPAPLASSYTLSIKAHRVNVNSLNSHTNSIAQDYALVISSGNVVSNNQINLVVTQPAFTNDPSPRLAGLPPVLVTNSVVDTNGITNEIISAVASLANQRVGANAALIVSTNGATNQWAFFTYQNPVTIPVLSNVIILTFLSPELSLRRFRDADIDLYVGRSSEGFTPAERDKFFYELDTNAVSATHKSTRRGGTEFLIFTNAEPGEFFYIGVKSEDQQGANFSIYAASSAAPFNSKDGNGNIVARAIPVPSEIPDGTPDQPGGTNLIAIFADGDVNVARVYVTNAIFHELGGDLVGILGHNDALGDGNDASVVLNNHRTWTNGLDVSVYDDADLDDLGPAVPPEMIIPPDGPGSLKGFIGQNANGPWTFTISDNALFHTGRVEQLTIGIEPSSDTNDPNIAISRVFCIPPQKWAYAAANIGVDVFNMETCLSRYQPAGLTPGLGVYIRQGQFPGFNNYDHTFAAPDPGACYDIGLGDNPPLTPGRYYFGFFNSNSVKICIYVRVTLSRTAIPGPYHHYTSTDTPMTLIDDAVTNSIIFVTNRAKVADLRVGLRVDHERASDLAFHLKAPSGKRLLLMENRGRTNDIGIGASITNIVTNVVRVVLNDGFERVPRVSPGAFVPGEYISGWLVTGLDVDVVSDGYKILGPAHNSSAKAVDLAGENGDGSIARNVATLPMALYRLSFAFCRNPLSDPSVVAELSLDMTSTATNWLFTNDVVNTPDDLKWSTTSFVFTASSTNVTIGFREISPSGPGISAGMLLDSVKLEQLDVITNLYLYTTFTENTNVTDTPIKFARPPFTNSVPPVARPVLDNGFDDITVIGYHSVGEWFSGWLVEAEPVQTDTTGLGGRLADSPPAYLEIAGITSTNLSLERGVDYTLSFSYLKKDTTPGSLDPSALVSLVGILDIPVTVSDTNWVRTNVDFTATSAGVTLRIEGLNAAAGCFDTFKVIRKTPPNAGTDAYFLAEEPLKPFVGEAAYGPWSLEVWDSRMGGAVTGTPQIVSWKLDVAVVQTNATFIRLDTNRNTFTTNVVGDGVIYFSVDLPCPAGAITNTLTNLTSPSSGLDLIFNQFTLPTNGPNDQFLLSGVTATESNVLIIGQPPLLFPTRYYLAVRNSNPNETNDFSLRIDFDCSPPFIDLSNHQEYCISVPSNSFDFYRYTARANTRQANFEVLSTSANVDLFVRSQIRPGIYTNLPGANAEYWSDNPGTLPEFIVVTNGGPTSGIAQFSPFEWYMGVTNASGGGASYCVRVTEILSNQVTSLIATDAPTAFATNVIAHEDYYIVEIPPCATAAQFVVNTNYGQLTLLLRNDYWGSTNSYHYSTNGADTPGSLIIQLDGSSTPVPLNPGYWYITVVHDIPTELVDYDISVLVVPAGCGGGIAPTISASASTYSAGTFTLKWSAPASEQYEVQYTDTLSPPDWKAVTTPVSSTNGEFQFLDDGTHTGGVSTQRFYRLKRVP